MARSVLARATSTGNHLDTLTRTRIASPTTLPGVDFSKMEVGRLAVCPTFLQLLRQKSWAENEGQNAQLFNTA